MATNIDDATWQTTTASTDANTGTSYNSIYDYDPSRLQGARERLQRRFRGSDPFENYEEELRERNNNNMISIQDDIKKFLENDMQYSTFEEYCIISRHHHTGLFLKFYKAILDKKKDLASIYSVLLTISRGSTLEYNPFNIIEALNKAVPASIKENKKEYIAYFNQVSIGGVRTLERDQMLDLLCRKCVNVIELIESIYTKRSHMQATGFDISVLYTLTDKDVLKRFISRGLYLMSFDMRQHDLFICVHSKRALRDFYMEATKRGIETDDMLRIALKCDILDYTGDVNSHLFYSPIINRLITFIHKKPYAFNPETNELSLGEIQDKEKVVNRMNKYCSKKVEFETITLNGLKVERKLFEEMTECDINMLVDNLKLEIEESK